MTQLAAVGLFRSENTTDDYSREGLFHRLRAPGGEFFRVVFVPLRNLAAILTQRRYLVVCSVQDYGRIMLDLVVPRLKLKTLMYVLRSDVAYTLQIYTLVSPYVASHCCVALLRIKRFK